MENCIDAYYDCIALCATIIVAWVCYYEFFIDFVGIEGIMLLISVSIMIALTAFVALAAYICYEEATKEDC